MIRNRIKNVQGFLSQVRTKKGSIELVSETLQEMFESAERRKKLGKTFRIFPTYFSTDKVLAFIRSPEIEKYLPHINSKKKRIIKGDQLKAILEDELGIKTDKKRKILEAFIDFSYNQYDMSENDLLMELLDIRNPHRWFEANKKGIKRKFVYHHGPTNSGKTFSAITELKQLTEQQKGIYMAPLRLLAWETQQKLGKCNLITGQEKDYQNSHLTSCTIEAGDLQQNYDVAIIDEIQMIGDQERGWGWTQALLAIPSKVIHLCGDERGLHLVSKILAKTGEQLEQKSYKRLSKLHLIQRNFDMSQLRPGDCLIDFSVKKLYGLREKINMKNEEPKGETAIVYGKLPPKTRKSQANLFNAQDLPYLVASNAIGMGLNLSINRVIFTNLYKTTKRGRKQIQDHEIRQIAGRAGRGTGQGYVQCSSGLIREKVKSALRNVNITVDMKGIEDPNKEVEIFQEYHKQIRISVFCPSLGRNLSEDECRLEKAGLFFPLMVVERIKTKIQCLAGTKITLSQTIRLIQELSIQNNDLYYIQRSDDFIMKAQMLEEFGLELDDQFLFSSFPFLGSRQDEQSKKIFLNYAKQFIQKGVVGIPSAIKQQYEDNKFGNYKRLKDIPSLQKFFNMIEGYTWFWNHYELQFPYNNEANEIKEGICEKINEILSKEIQQRKGEKQ